MSKEWEFERPKPVVIFAVILSTIVATLVAQAVVKNIPFLNPKPEISVMYRPITDLKTDDHIELKQLLPDAVDIISISHSKKKEDLLFFAGSINEEVLVFCTDTIEFIFDRDSIQITGDMKQIRTVRMKSGGTIIFHGVEKNSPQLPKMEGENITTLFCKESGHLSH